jgi:hypothetical protein
VGERVIDGGLEAGGGEGVGQGGDSGRWEAEVLPLLPGDVFGG